MSLIDIFDLIVPDENIYLFEREKDLYDFCESCLHLFDEYLIHNLDIFDEDLDVFEEVLFEEVKEFIMLQMEHHVFFDEENEFDIEHIFEDVFEIYMSTFIRDYELSSLKEMYESLNRQTNIEKPDNERFHKRLAELRAKPQPTQRTPEWYLFRHNLITASNAYKAFESQAQINNLIYEKCQPLKTFETDTQTSVNINSSLHWGQKYEPLSVILYEKLYNTTVEDFGCIQHEKYSFLGASPDGINSDPKSEKFGRMLEIKNVVSREITGIPKREYWVQTQLQMEVCDLDECDFLETKFVEFENINDFLNDTSEKKKGIIMYFHSNKSNKPHYIYKLLEDMSKEKIQQWEEEMIEKHQKNDDMIWMKNYFWKCEVFSCVLIQRDTLWFKNNIGQLANVWSIIEEERVKGFEHRAPKRREKKEPERPYVSASSSSESKPKCLINVVKLGLKK